MDYSFNGEVAKLYGVDGAIFIHNIYWWVRKNKANGTTFTTANGGHTTVFRLGMSFFHFLRLTKLGGFQNALKKPGQIS